jgi:hypothetical protein
VRRLEDIHEGFEAAMLRALFGSTELDLEAIVAGSTRRDSIESLESRLRALPLIMIKDHDKFAAVLDDRATGGMMRTLTTTTLPTLARLSDNRSVRNEHVW